MSARDAYFFPRHTTPVYIRRTKKKVRFFHLEVMDANLASQQQKSAFGFCYAGWCFWGNKCFFSDITLKGSSQAGPGRQGMRTFARVLLLEKIVAANCHYTAILHCICQTERVESVSWVLVLAQFDEIFSHLYFAFLLSTHVKCKSPAWEVFPWKREKGI